MLKISHYNVTICPIFWYNGGTSHIPKGYGYNVWRPAILPKSRGNETPKHKLFSGKGLTDEINPIFQIADCSAIYHRPARSQHWLGVILSFLGLNCLFCHFWVSQKLRSSPSFYPHLWGVFAPLGRVFGPTAVGEHLTRGHRLDLKERTRDKTAYSNIGIVWFSVTGRIPVFTRV